MTHLPQSIQLRISQISKILYLLDFDISNLFVLSYIFLTTIRCSISDGDSPVSFLHFSFCVCHQHGVIYIYLMLFLVRVLVLLQSLHYNGDKTHLCPIPTSIFLYFVCLIRLLSVSGLLLVYIIDYSNLSQVVFLAVQINLSVIYYQMV